jgi:hypothetical protein
MLFKNRCRAVYSCAVHGNVIAIHRRPRLAGFDLWHYHVIYKDTRGIWDQILVDHTGCFAGFSSINERDLPAAIARLTRH